MAFFSMSLRFTLPKGNKRIDQFATKDGQLFLHKGKDSWGVTEQRKRDPQKTANFEDAKEARSKFEEIKKELKADQGKERWRG